ncbi:horcolin-like isoform X2 [Ananas comosus]|uniref:Horcolin-like isoform X2 n=1 Tax=Ananas comosus TaxID=4615 RepID=A0A6P5F7Y0_ANACO|nr:horcolin-like isoform X2 [Ananas comosus]
MQLMKMGPCGGDGGSQKDMDIRGVTRIAKVMVRSGHTIDAVSILYERNGNLEWSSQWGGRGGSINEINLARNEYLTSVVGHYGYYKKDFVIRSLTFFSNLHTYGPYGRQEGIAFALPSARGKIVGFHARSGLFLDAIGTYVKID